MADSVAVLSAGAAQGLIGALADTLRQQLDVVTTGRFGAVGAMQDAFRAGEPCDVFVSTHTMIEAMITSGELSADGAGPIGKVSTGVAVPAGRPMPSVSAPEDFAGALSSASTLWVPDMFKSTAGQHIARVLEALGLRQALDSRIRMFANGATAMKAMADSGDPHALGCTQMSEILFTPGVQWVDALPREFELATTYSAAVSGRASRADLARAVVQQLRAHHHDELARRCGFER